MAPAIYKVRVQLAPVLCWRCGQGMKAVRGYVFDDVFISLKSVSDRRQISAMISDLRKRDAAVTPIGIRYSATMKGRYFAAWCPHCSGICGEFYVTTSTFFTDRVLCDYPYCGCVYCDTQCRSFEYHPLALRLGPEELEEIEQWRGATR